MDIDSGGKATKTSFSGAFNRYDPATGRGVAGITSQPGGVLFYAFYLVSSRDHQQNDLILMSTDPVSQSAPLTLWSGIQQATPASGWDNTYLTGTAVAGLNALDTNGAVDVSAGLFGGSGTAGYTCQLFAFDSATFNFDQNQGGTSTLKQSSTGRYCVDQVTGRVTLKNFGGQFGKFPPVFYLVAANQGFVVGTNPAVSSGNLEMQSGPPLSNASIIGAYAGGSVAPVTSAVTDTASWLFSDGGGNIKVTQNSNGPGGPGQANFNYTYAVDSTGRAVMQQNGNAVGILYAFSPQRFVMLPTVDPSPALSVFSTAGAN